VRWARACCCWARRRRRRRAKKGDHEIAACGVRMTAQEQSKGAVIRGISQEVEDGKTLYEVELKVNGRTKDVTIAADGTVLTIEEEIALAALPPAVKATIEKGAGKGKILLVESVTEGGTLAFYEAHVRTGKKESEIKVRPDGQLIPEEKKK
jgi:uncharacterized membrane protein YkoI